MLRNLIGASLFLLIVWLLIVSCEGKEVQPLVGLSYHNNPATADLRNVDWSCGQLLDTQNKPLGKWVFAPIPWLGHYNSERIQIAQGDEMISPTLLDFSNKQVSIPDSVKNLTEA